MNQRLSPEESDPGLDVALLRRRREWVLTLTAIAVVVLASLIVAYRVTLPQAVDRQALVSPAQQAIRDALGPRFVYIFGSPREVSFTEEAEDRYRLKGEVLAITQQGTSIHYWYDCQLRRHPEGAWLSTQLTLTPE